MTTALETEIQSLSPSALVELFTLDTTSVGGPVLTFTQNIHGTAELVFGGTTYTAIDIDFRDMETTGIGALPQPKLVLANDANVQGLVNLYGDLNGCLLTRIRTFKTFLDGEPAADPLSYYGPDVFRVERKSEDSPEAVTWELSAAIDQEGKMLPGRSMIRNTCLWRYRYWTGAAFDYSRVLCPYTGSSYWDEFDNPTADPAKDQPSRTRNCCRLRFGESQPWPFGGFPGMGRGL